MELYQLCLPESESTPTALYIRTEGIVTQVANHLKLAYDSAVILIFIFLSFLIIICYGGGIQP